MVSVEGAVVICRAGFQATCLTLNVREELDNVLTIKVWLQISHGIPIKGWLQISHRISHLTKGPLDGPAAQLLLLGAGVGLGDALLALEHLGAGGEEEAGLGKGEAGRRKVRLMLVI